MAGPLDLLLQSSARLFADACTPELQERVESGAWPSELWQAIDDNGLPLLLVAEEEGGIGLGWPEAVAVLRLAGSFAVPAPLAEAMLGQRLLADAGLRPSSRHPCLAVAPWRFRDRLALQHENGVVGTVLSGSAARVPWLGSLPPGAQIALFAEDGDSRPWAVRADREIGEARRQRSAAGEPVADLILDGAPIETGARAALPAELDAEAFLARMALARSAQMAGAMDRVLDLTVEHARERQQFGRPIARFQAVQQQIAALAAEVAVVGAAVDAAAESLQRSSRRGPGPPDAARLAVAAAKARAGEAVSRVTAIAHQVHGAIGFTREHLLHRFSRRLWTWRDEAGSDRDWLQRVGQQAAAAGAEGLWDLLSAP